MTKRYCDCCKQEMPKSTNSEIVFSFTTPQQHIFTVKVAAGRDHDLCIGCQRKVVAEGQAR